MKWGNDFLSIVDVNFMEMFLKFEEIVAKFYMNKISMSVSRKNFKFALSV